MRRHASRHMEALHRAECTLKRGSFRMGTINFAMWLQDTDPSGTRHLILIAIGLMAVAIAVISGIMLVIGVKAMKTIKELGETAQEVKIKVMPLLDEVMQISRTSRILLDDAAPKLKIISENLVKTSETLVETSNVARGATNRCDGDGCEYAGAASSGTRGWNGFGGADDHGRGGGYDRQRNSGAGATCGIGRSMLPKV